MGLEVQFLDVTQARPARVDQFQVREADGAWLLPAIVLAPKDRLPHLTRVSVSVVGQPAAVAKRILDAHPSRTFTTPLALTDRKSLGMGRIDNAGPLPAEIACELTVTLAYLDSDAKGRPSGNEVLVTQTCKLLSAPRSAAAAELTVQPIDLAITLGQATQLGVVVRGTHEGTPRVGLVFPEEVLGPHDPMAARLAPVLPELRQALGQALSQTPQVQVTGPAETRYALPVMVPLGQAAVNLLADVAEAVLVPVQTLLEGARPVQHLLRLESHQRQFPGWLVVDFGTSNSTVTVYDPRTMPPEDGLPDEQESVLRRSLADWLRLPALESLAPHGRAFESDWLRLKTQVARMLGLGDGSALPGLFQTAPKPRFYEALAQLEMTLRSLPEPFRRLFGRRLHQLHHDALHTPSLVKMHLYPVPLDLTRNEVTVASELEIAGLRPHGERDQFVDVEMGDKVRQNRLEAIARSDASSLGDVLGRFHPSPKRYFGTDQPPFTVNLGGQRQIVSVDQLMRAGWGQLIRLTERVREQDRRFNPGPFRRVVVTYPTVAPPSVRQSIQRLLRDLNISDVRTDYDEAVAAAIFYLLRECGGAREIGLESFKARCRTRGDNAWTQNVLVFDIGGGTTDVALIRLTLTEEDPFQSSEDRGAGGRYYKITPELLSSTGHMQLGGELMTLRVFRLLKAMLADRLLTLVQEAKFRCESLKALLAGGMPEGAVESNGKYRAGWLVDVVGQDDPERDHSRLKDALDLSERVLPTRWAGEGENRFARLQAFFTLWEHAERAKKTLGTRKPSGGTLEASYFVKPEEVRELLEQCLGEQDFKATDAARDLRLELKVGPFETAIGQVVHDAVTIARGTLERLRDRETVDWLILSGQSCNLALVDRELQQQFGKPGDAEAKFVWNPERVTFLPQYAKLATSIGACCAEAYRRLRFAPQESKDALRQGYNLLYFDINNLFSYLPCSFDLVIQGGSQQKIFRAGEQMFELEVAQGEDNRRGKARSAWMGSILHAVVYRVDSEKSPQFFWGTFGGQALVDRLGFSTPEWLNTVKMQFEVDHRLMMDVLLYRTESPDAPPHHRALGSEPRLNLTPVLERLAQQTTQPPQTAPAGKTPPKPAAPGLFNGDQLEWRIATADPLTGHKIVLFERHDRLTSRLHTGDADATGKRAALARTWVEGFPAQGRLEVWGCPPGTETWHRLGDLEKPADTPVFRRRYRVSLDQDGMLRIHDGEAPYWESNNPEVLRKLPGCVYRTRLELRPREADMDRNPFSGMH